jgi:hypothetical protein
MITGESRLRGRGAGSTSTVISTRILAAVYTSAQVPVLWLYAENDNHLPDTVRAWFTAFQQAGGSGSVVIEPRYRTDGHGIVSQPSLYIDDIYIFFGTVGFVHN